MISNVVTNNRITYLIFRFVFAPVFLLLQSLPLSAANWTISPGVTISESYIDNLTLAPKGFETDDYVTQLNPFIGVAGEGNRLSMRMNYSMQNIFYMESGDDNTLNHQFGLNADAELVDQFFFLNAASTFTQQNISSEGVVSLDNLSITSNRTDTTTYLINPYLTHKFGSTMNATLGYQFDSVQYEGSNEDTNNSEVYTQLSSGPAFDRLIWTLSYKHREVDRFHRDDVPDATFENAKIGLRIPVGAKLSLLGSAGYEKNDYGFTPLGDEPEGSTWSAGFAWNPRQRTLLELAVGESFYGQTGSALFRNNTRRTTWEIRYNEEVTTASDVFLENQLANLPAETTTGAIPASSSVRLPSVTSDISINKGLSAAVTYRLAKSRLSFDVFSDRYKFQNDLSEEKIYGGNASWKWQFRPRTSTNVSSYWQRRIFRITERSDELSYVTLGLNHNFGINATGSVYYRYNQRNSTNVLSEYQQNTVTASLELQF